jgi:hypothetical protein
MHQGNAPLSQPSQLKPIVADHANTDLSGQNAAGQHTAGQPSMIAPATTPLPDKYVLETRLIELGAALTSAQHLFRKLERDFYLASFGRYDE